MTLQPHALWDAQRTLFVLAEKPSTHATDKKEFWYLPLAGLHSEHLKAAVDQLRMQQRGSARTKSEKHSLKSTAVQDSLAQALGAASYEHWRETELPKLHDLLAQHGLHRPTDLIKWAHAPFLSGGLKARQVSDRLFNSKLPLPTRIFTGVGSHLFSPSGYGRLDIDHVAGRSLSSDAHRYQFCQERADAIVLRAVHMQPGEGVPAHLDLTGRALMLNAVQEYVWCAYNMLGDNLSDPAPVAPVLRSYGPAGTDHTSELRAFQLFREEIEQSSAGWVEVLPVPGNGNVIILKGADGTFDWVVRDQRDAGLSSNPLYPFFSKDELPAAMDTSQLAAREYFTRGGWHEKLEHDAEARHYEEGGTAANWPGYDKLIEKELLATERASLPKRITARASASFVSHRVGEYRLMVSPLITIDQFLSFADETDWNRTRLEKAHTAGLAIERNLMSVNAGDAGDLPVSVTWLDAIAYCRDFERRHGLPVRLLEPEEWQQIAPAPSVDRSRAQGSGYFQAKAGEMPVDPIYEQLSWAVVGGDGKLGKNSWHCDHPDGELSFGPGLQWTTNAEGLKFLSVAGFMEWLSGYQGASPGGYAPYAEAGRGLVNVGAGQFGNVEPAHLAMRHEGAKVGFRLCYVAHPDS